MESTAPAIVLLHNIDACTDLEKERESAQVEI